MCHVREQENIPNTLGKLVSILIRKWRGQLSAREEENLQELLDREENREEASVLEKVWQASQSYRSSYEPGVELGWNRFEQTIQPKPLPHPVWTWGLAVVLALALIALGFWLSKVLSPREDIRKQPALAVYEQSEAFYNLTDGSTVLLNEGSQLEILREEKSEIILELHGEGYFRVKPDPGRSFVVYAGGAMVEVVGTAFNLRSVPDDSYTEIEVETGEVKFMDLETREIKRVRTQERAVCSAGKGMHTSQAPNLNAHAWRTGEMVWLDAPLPEIVTDLEHFFGIQIDMEKNMPARNCTFSNKVNRNSDVRQVFSSMSRVHSFQFDSLEGGHYRLYGGKACPTR